MILEIYTRDTSTGAISYHGPQDWASRDQALQYFFRDDEVASAEQMLGWPHCVVTWHGNLGFGEVLP